MTETLAEVLARDHLECDVLYGIVERAVQGRDWPAASAAMERFAAATLRHFKIEEEQLFPALEKAMPGASDPANVMRSEHADLREFFVVLTMSIEQRDAAEFEGHSEAFVILGQQHNMKEEHVLYPMCDEVLATAGSSWVQEVTEQLRDAAGAA